MLLFPTKETFTPLSSFSESSNTVVDGTSVTPESIEIAALWSSLPCSVTSVADTIPEPPPPISPLFIAVPIVLTSDASLFQSSAYNASPVLKPVLWFKFNCKDILFKF